MAISSEQFYGNSSEISSEKDNASPKQNKYLPNTQRKATTSSERKIRPPEFKSRNHFRSQTPTYSNYPGKRTSSPSSTTYSFKSKPTKDRRLFDSIPRKPPLSDDNNRNYPNNRRTMTYLPKYNKPRTASMASSSQKENNNKSPDKCFVSENSNDSLNLASLDENSNHDRIPQGLHNYGNTCYVNSVLQTVFSLNFFMDKLADIVNKQKEQKVFTDDELKKLPLVFKLIEFYREFTSLHPSKSILNDAILTIKNCIAEHVNTTFASARQQCAAEFLTVILEELKNEFDFLTDKRIPNLVDKTFQYTLIQRRYCSICNKNISETSYVSSTFYLALTDCRNVQSSFLHFLNDEEPNTSKCPDCESKLASTKLFNDVPKVLFFQVLRYSHEFMKDTMAFDASAFIYLPKRFFKNQEMFLSPLATPYKRGLRNIQSLYSNLKKDCVKKLTFEENEHLSNLPMVSSDGQLFEDDLLHLDGNNNNGEDNNNNVNCALAGGNNVHLNNNIDCDNSLNNNNDNNNNTNIGMTNGESIDDKNLCYNKDNKEKIMNGTIDSAKIIEPNFAQEADCILAQPMTPDFDKAGPSDESPTSEQFEQSRSTLCGVLTPESECDPSSIVMSESNDPTPAFAPSSSSSSSTSTVTHTKAQEVLLSSETVMDMMDTSPGSISPSELNERIGDSERYQLVSIISHHGSQMSFGHYTASVFNSARSSWFYCDDNNIHSVPFDHVRQSCSRTGCCYLYVHCDP